MMRLLIVKAIVSVMLLSTMLLLIVSFLFASKTGSSLLISFLVPYVEKALPQLSLSSIESPHSHGNAGRALIDGLSLKQFVWQDDAVTIVGDELDIQFTFFCAPSVVICIEQLTLNTIDITLSGKSETSSAVVQPKNHKSITLPTLSTPYPVYIKQLVFNKININPIQTENLNPTEQSDHQAQAYLQNINWQANNLLLRRSNFRVSHSVLHNPFFKHILNGKITLDGEYPVNMQQNIKIYATEKNQAIESNIALSGTVAQLQLDIQTEQPERIRLTASLQPLGAILAGNIDVHAASINPAQWLTSDAALKTTDVSLSLAGNTSHFTIKADATVIDDSDTRTIPLQLIAAVEADQLSVESLVFGSTDNRLLAKGKINWRGKVNGLFHLNFDHFTPPAINAFNAGDIHGSIDLQFNRLHDLSNRESASRGLSSPKLSNYRFASTLRDIRFKIEERAYYLSGSAVYNTDRITLVDLKFGTPLNKLTMDATLKAMNPTQLSSIDNIFDWLNRSTIKANVVANKLDEFHPLLSGKLVADINSSKNNFVTLTASAQALKLGDKSIESLSLNIDMPTLNVTNKVLDRQKGSRGKIDLAVQAIEGWGISFDNINLLATGHINKHTITVNASSPTININSELASTFQNQFNQWQAKLIRLDGSYQNNNSTNSFRLIDPVTVEQNKKKRLLDISRGCIAIDQGSLCIEASEIAGNQFELPFTLKGISLTTLNTLIPPALRFDGELFGTGSIKKTDSSGLTFLAQLESPTGTIKNRTTDIPITLDFKAFILGLEMTPNAFAVAAGFKLNDNSSANMSLSLTGKKFDRIDAHANFLDLPIGVFAPLMPQAQALKGRLNVELIANGSLKKPQFIGNAALTKGSFQLTQSTSTIRDISIDGQFDGSKITLVGAFNLGGGNGKIQGELDFSNELAGKIRLTGQQLQIKSEPELDININTDMTLQIADRVIFASGNLFIPEGRIHMLKLPVNAITLSKDVKFVQEERLQAQAFQLKTDLNVSIGPNLSFSGFEASGQLKGSLQIKNDVDKPFFANGEIDFTNSKYRGYGQRLDVRRGRLLFLGPLDMPKIDLEAVRQVADTTVGLKAYGNAKNPQITPFSEPSLPDNDIIYMLVTGSKIGQNTTRSQDQMVAYALLASSVKVGEKSISETAEKIGVSDFNIGSSDNSDLLLSGYLNPALYLEYGVNVLGDANAFKLRWDFTKQFSLEFISGIQSSMDIIYAREF